MGKLRKISDILFSHLVTEHSVEKREILSHSLTEKIFREINSLVTYSINPLLSRNFCSKSFRENLRNFLTCTVPK